MPRENKRANVRILVQSVRALVLDASETTRGNMRGEKGREMTKGGNMRGEKGREMGDAGHPDNLT